MSPVAHEARYYRARLAAQRAWANSQPQYVIPGLLNGLDDAPLTARGSAGRKHEAARTGSIVEPASSAPSSLAGVAGSTQTEAADRLSLQEQARSAARRSF